MRKLEGSKTEKNLITALEGEAFAHMKYAYYASQAKKDGFVEIQDIFLETSANEKEHGKIWFDDIAELFELTSTVEKAHEERYRQLAKNIQKDNVFKKPKEIVWKCNNCGYLHRGKNAPDVCPLCDHPQAHFRKLTKGYE